MSRTVESEYDCVRCGACCVNPDENRTIGFADWVQVAEGDAILADRKLVRRFVVLNDKNERHMRLTHEGACAALRGELGHSVECSVYESRPGVCRAMQPGSEACIRARTEHGFEKQRG